MPPATLAGLLDRVAEPASPLVTFYDESTGERVELSAVTTANWVAKTANLLVDELDAGPGTRIRVGLPTHWLRVVWLLSAWTVGAVVTDTDADIGVSGPELVGDEPQRLAASLRPLGARFPEPPAGFLDLGVEVPGHGDVFVPLEAPTPHTPALDLDGTVRSHADVLAATVADGERLLVGPGPLQRDADLLVAALLGGGSLVLVTGASGAAADHIAAQERARVR